MVVDATSPILKWNAIHRLVNRNANWKRCIQFELVMRRVNERVFNRDTKMQPAWARLTEHALAFDRRPRRFDADDAKVKEAAPAGDIGEQSPHDADGRIDNRGWTSCVVCRRNADRISWVDGRTLN